MSTHLFDQLQCRIPFTCLVGLSCCAKNITSYCTSYGYNDNSPPSAEIAYPKSDGHNTTHNEATEGTGAYDDPITFATDKSEFGVGTIIYVPYLRKYFIMEDDCVECDSDWKKGKHHVDLWMGPGHSMPGDTLDNCEGYITKSSATIIFDPPKNLPVNTGHLIDWTSGKCTAQIYGGDFDIGKFQ